MIEHKIFSINGLVNLHYVCAMEQIDNVKILKRLSKYSKLLVIVALLMIVAFLVFIQQNYFSNQATAAVITSPKVEKYLITEDYEVPSFEKNPEGESAEYGLRLITETYAEIGPETKKGITGNRLACSNCHLKGGTKPFAAPYIGLSAVFPMYIGRENKLVSLEERINGCLERSMNGHAIDVNSEEMRAMITYIKHISKEAAVGSRLQGQGFVAFEAPERAASPEKGLLVYNKHCVSCHAADGQGVRGSETHKKGGYVYPPLWGPDSYNDGAGMARLLTAAKFIKGNMPLGATAENPQLSDEEAYDVASYINSHSRPEKAGKENDYPNLSKKPKDCPYPPYADQIPQQQHKYGPYQFSKTN